MVNAEYRPRLIDKEIERKLGIFKAICIQGPKASGKTWAAAEHSRSSIMLGDPSGSFENRRLTELDPFHALSGEEPHLIDEWQEVPSLWDAVRHQVDTDSRKGRYILTGSSTPVNKGIMHSGTGRIDTVSMRTMSLFESGESSGRVSLSSLFDGGFGGMVDNDAPRLEELAYYIIRGGWPEAITIPPDSAHYFARSYVNGLLTEDIPRIAPGTNLDKMSRFMRSLARNESTTASKRTIQRDLNGDISDETIDNYSNILARLFIIADQRPYSPSVRSSVRLKQMSKRHLTDPSLAAALLGLSVKSLFSDLQTFGFLFEALAERDLAVYAAAGDSAVMHYQDYRDNEADAVVVREDGRFGLIEIKLGTAEIDSAAKSLLKIQAVMASSGAEPSFLCVISGMSRYAYRRQDGVYVIPLTALRD